MKTVLGCVGPELRREAQTRERDLEVSVWLVVVEMVQGEGTKGEKRQARIDPRRSRSWYKRLRKGGHCGKSRPSSQGEGLFSQVSNELA